MKNLFVAAIITLFLSACSTASERAFSDPGFAAFMDANVEKIMKNPNPSF